MEDHKAMWSWIRFDNDQYNQLLELVTPLIVQSDTRMRKAVTAHNLDLDVYVWHILRN